MKAIPFKAGIAASLMVFTLHGCGGEDEGWAPVLERTSTTFLQTEAERALQQVRLALERIDSERSELEEILLSAEMTLEHLSDYYLPLLEARELAYNAYRFHTFGEDARTLDELEQIEEILLRLQETSGGRLGPELVEPLGTVEQIRVALAGTGSGATRLLEDLARRLNQMALKGELILSEG